jgi:catechol 2,3-dioxygenase-like lactoylglutathione lyase family enzyme
MHNAILDVTYGASDIERASQFYDAALGALGIRRMPRRGGHVGARITRPMASA